MGQHRAVLRPFRSSVPCALAALALAHALVLTAPAGAQESEERARPTRSTAGTLTLRWEPGPAPELWAAPAVGLGLGGLTLALAVVLGQVATANHREATDPATTQLRASQLASTVPDLSLAANVLFAVGGGMALIGATWLVVLPFSQHPSSQQPGAGSVRASVGPGGLTLSGSF